MHFRCSGGVKVYMNVMAHEGMLHISHEGTRAREANETVISRKEPTCADTIFLKRKLSTSSSERQIP